MPPPSARHVSLTRGSMARGDGPVRSELWRRAAVRGRRVIASAAAVRDPMARAIDLARQALGATSPNPAVGAVLVRDGTVVGEGATRPPGQEHAEIVALRQAGVQAGGATLFVTLEPCAHQGRTPPCTDAIIAAGVAEVRCALGDPSPHNAGRGRQALEAAGIPIVVGERAREAAEINEGYLRWTLARIPFVTAKFALSLDGKIATRAGDSRWVSSAQARAVAHLHRTTVDAILVGISTVLVDDPQLTARPYGAEASRQPLRVVVDSRLRTPLTARVLSGPGRALIVCAEGAESGRRAELAAGGAEVVAISAARDGKVELGALLRWLGEQEITSLLVEGGGVILGSFFDGGLVDKVMAIVAPMVIGGAEAPTAVTGRGVARVGDAHVLQDVRWSRLGDDMLAVGYLHGSGGVG